MIFLGRLTTLFASLVISLLLAEVFLRVFPGLVKKGIVDVSWSHLVVDHDYEEALDFYNTAYVYDPDVGFVDMSVIDKIQERSNEPDLPAYSILVLGDSVSATGFYVSKLQDTLFEIYGNAVDILNGGVIGYDSQLEELFLKKYGYQYNPDLVILQFNTNDFNGTPVIVRNPDNSWFAFSPNQRTSRIHSLNPFLFQHSRLYQFVMVTYLKQFVETDYSLDTVRDSLENIHSYLESKNVDFLLVYLPFFGDSPQRERYHEMFLGIVSDLQLEGKTLDLTDDYSNFQVNEVSLDQSHPNEFGDVIMSRKIFEYIQPIIDEAVKPEE